ncbi:hypothetical protein QA597_08310 [Marinilabiliaceae bacterium ANBcel2]|nr:hypothetical protein [Marinilabiliaceae bacterium ANBcel2]
MRAIKRVVAAVVMLMFVSSVSFSQKEVTKFLQEMGHQSINDAEIMSKEYLRPYGEILGGSLSGNWNNSARVHRILGFDFTVGVNMVTVPSADQNFDVGALIESGAFEGDWSLADPSNNMAPTIAGSMSNRAALTYGDTGEDFTLPNGTGFDRVFMPLAQAAVGLPFGFEVSLRYLPSMSVSDAGKVGMYGFALKKDVKDYLPLLNNVPFLQSTLMGGYTNFSSDIDVETFGNSNWQNNSLDVTAGSLTTRWMVGVNLPVIAVYTGLGYSTTSSDFDLKGDYGQLGTDPVSLGYSTNGFDFNAGMRMRLGVFAIHGDYTFGDYSMLSFGVGLSFR